MLHRDGRKLIINLKNLNPVWWFLDKCINVRTIASDVRSKSFKRSSIFRNNKSHKLDTSFQFDSNIKTSLTNFKKLEIKQRRKRNGGENSRKFCRKPRVRKIKKEEKERVNFNFPSPFLQRAPITTTSVTGRKRSYLSTLLPRKTQMQMQRKGGKRWRSNLWITTKQRTERKPSPRDSSSSLESNSISGLMEAAFVDLAESRAWSLWYKVRMADEWRGKKLARNKSSFLPSVPAP